jgi:uncharacterized protein
MSKNDLNRRIFLKTSLLGATGAVVTKANAESVSYTGSEKSKRKVVRRKLGRTGLKLPVVSFGVMRADNPNLIKAALNAGVEHFDTAYVYQKGNNEKMLGEILKDVPRKSFTIATKVKFSDKADFNEKLNTSLERLQMDYVEILYVHALSSREEVLSEPLRETLLEVKKQGKAKHIGLSTHSHEPEVIAAAIESGIYEVILTAYNFKQDHKEELAKQIEKASKAGIGIVAMKTMAGGKLGKEAQKMQYQAALKWALRTPHVHTTIPGITNFQELEENLAIMENLDLTNEEEEFLSFASRMEGLYCNACDVCTGSCPVNIPIHDIMRAYMYAYGYGEMNKAKEELTRLGINDNPCKDCLICTARCVKGFDLRGKISDITRITNVPDEFLV